MPTLDPSTTGDTTPDVHLEASDDRPDHRKIFLILGSDPHDLQGAPTARARCGERRVVGHIHARGNRAARPAAISPTGAPARLSTPALRAVFGERRSLSEARAPRRVELPLQTRILLLQSVAIPTRPSQLLAQACDFFLLACEQIVTVFAGRSPALRCHTRFMADSRQKYKYKIVGLSLELSCGSTR